MVGLQVGAVSTSDITDALAGLQQAGCGDSLHGATGCSVWDHRDALRGSRSRRKAGSSRGPGRAAGSQQAVLLLPTALGSTQGKAGAGHCAPAGPPPLAPALILSRPAPGAAPSRSQLCLEPVPAVLAAGKSTFPDGRAAHICLSASQPRPAIPVRASAPSQPSQRPRTGGEQKSGPCPPQVKAAGHWAP